MGKKKGLQCGFCGGTAYEAKLRFQGFDIDGWHCSKCGEDAFDPIQADRILKLNKFLKKEYEITVGQISNSLIIRIPKELADLMEIQKGEKVKLKLDDMHTFHVEA